MANVAFILGGGPRIGHGVAEALSAQGYRVALGRRNADASSLPGIHTVSVDVTKPESVANAFASVEKELGAPSVVVYNVPSDSGNPFSVPPETFENDTRINLEGGYTALYHSVRAFKKHGKGVFIATGNVTPFKPNPLATSLAPGKSGLVQLIRLGEQEFQKQGYRFYFASQVTSDDEPVPYADVDGPAHGKVYAELAKGAHKNWDVRFLAGGDIV